MQVRAVTGGQNDNYDATGDEDDDDDDKSKVIARHFSNQIAFNNIVIYCRVTNLKI